MIRDRLIFMYIREYFRENPVTNWGKNQIVIKLDTLENEIILILDGEKDAEQK